MTFKPNPTILELRELIDIDSLDYLPILDIDGGINGRPKTKRVGISRLQAYLALSANSRNIASLTTLNLASLDKYVGSIVLAKSFLLLKVTTNISTRISLYSRLDKQTQDLGRNIGVKPVGQHGLILEAITAQNNLSYVLSPQVIGASCEDTPTELIPITITNLSANTALITVTLEYIILGT